MPETRGIKRAFRGDGSGRLLWPHTPWQVAAIFAAETLGTFFLLFVGCAGSLQPLSGVGDALHVQGAIAFGCVVMFCILIIAHTSNAHLNPAVSLCALLLGHIRIVTFFVYVAAEMLGCILGVGLLKAVTPVSGNGTCCHTCVTKPHVALTSVQGFIIEFAITSVLIFVVCAVWDPRSKGASDAVPIKFGLTIAGIALATGQLTGASMNPARSFAPALWENDWERHWVYWAGPMLAAIFATLFYMYVLDNEKARNKEPEEVRLTAIKNDTEAGRRRADQE